MWHGWHGFRRGLASNLNRLGVDDSVIQRILRHSTVQVMQNHYIKTASPDAVAAMRLFSTAFSNCAPLVLQNVENTSKGVIQQEQVECRQVLYSAL